MNKVRFLSLLILSLFGFNTLSAQSFSGKQIFVGSLIVIGVLVFLWVILMIAENLMQIEAKKMGADTEEGKFSLIPSVARIFGKSIPEYVGNYPYFNLKRGFDIKLSGKAETVINSSIKAITFAVMPPDFHGISPIPKVVVEQGQEVKAGDVLFIDKKRPDIQYVAPVSGEVIAINRGPKRSIAEVVILADTKQSSAAFVVPDLDKASEEELILFMKKSGLWVLLNERPYDVVPGDDRPGNIFISTFDTAPMAPDLNFIMQGRGASFQKGLDVLNRLTEGKVYLGLSANGEHAPSEVFTKAKNVELVYFSGKHPAGNVGVQIHHIAPIRGQNKVWTVGVQEVAQIGEMFISETYDASRIISINGNDVKNAAYVKTYLGANTAELLKDQLQAENQRIISGDPLSGKKVTEKGFLSFHDDQLTVIEEGDEYEMFGWLLPLTPRPSASGTFPNFLFKNYAFEANTNTHGEPRAFVMTGQYEEVLPLDIYPQQLMKAVLNEDIEKMEGLGINELTEEDIAICEFVCTSKMPLQSMLRKGLDMMREQA